MKNATAVVSSNNDLVIMETSQSTTADVSENCPSLMPKDPRLRQPLQNGINSHWQADQIPAAKKRSYGQRELNKDFLAKRPAINSNFTVSTFNRFSPISNSDTLIEIDQPRIPKPEPIFVTGVNSIHELKTILLTIFPENSETVYKMTTMKSGHTVKIMPTDIETYKQIRDKFLATNISHYTYQLKHERAYRVVMRGMHHSEDQEQIKVGLKSYGHIVRNVTNVLHRQTKQPLALFYIDLEPSPNNKDIFNVKHINHTIVTFESPYTKREVVQCKRCQRFGHTKNQCNRPFRCVKCGGDHATDKCTKLPEVAAVCINCGSNNHPASYKGCKTYQEYKSRIYEPLRKRSNTNNNSTTQETLTTQPITSCNPETTTPRASYADKLKENTNTTQPQNQTNSENSSNILYAVEQMFSRFERMLERMMDRVIDLVMTKLTTK